MAGLFQPKRVVVPGTLSDEGLALRVKDLMREQTATADNAPPNSSAVEFADQVTTLEAGKLSKVAETKTRLAAQDARSTEIGGAIAGAVGAVPGVKELGQIGVLSDEQAAKEQAARVKSAQEEVDYLRDLNKAIETGKVPVSTIPGSDQEKLQFAVDQLAGRRRALIEAEEELTRLSTGPNPKYEWWRNAAEVAARSAVMVGLDTLKYPVSVWDLTAETITGEQNRSDLGIVLDGVDKALTKLLPGDPARAKDFVTDVASGVGSMSGFLVGGFVARAVGLPAAVGSGVLGAAVTGNAQYEDAHNFDATVAEKWFALLLGTGLGATEAIPIDRAFFRADVATGGLVRQLLKNTTATSLEEFTQELGQAVGEDLIAKFTYDEARDLDAGSWLRQATVGAIVGGGSGAVISLIEQGGERREVEVAKTDDTAMTTAAQEAIDAAQAEFDTALGDEAADLPGLGGTVDGVPADQAAQAPAGDGAVAGDAVAGAQAEVARPDPVVAGDAVKQIVEQQRAYHGTPHRFDKFSMAKIGTGEGAQAFGYGLYFAGNRDVAEHYQTMLSDVKVALEGAGEIDLADPMKDPSLAAVIYGEDTFQGAVVASNVIRTLGRDLATGKTLDAAIDLQERYIASWGRDQELASKALSFLRANAQVSSSGALYQVDIPDDAELLDWDAPLSAQPETVRDKLEAAIDSLGGEISFQAVEDVLEQDPRVASYGEFYRALTDQLGADPATVSKALLDAGIPGLRYLDGGSRADGDGTRNYVIFDENRIQIEDVEAQVGAPVNPDIAAQVDAVILDPHQLSPLPNLEKGLTGPIPRVVQAAKAYANAIGLPHRRAREYVKVDTARAARIADAYAAMKHEPMDPAVQASYRAMAEETIAQYQYVKASGIKIEAIVPVELPETSPGVFSEDATTRMHLTTRKDANGEYIEEEVTEQWSYSSTPTVVGGAGVENAETRQGFYVTRTQTRNGTVYRKEVLGDDGQWYPASEIGGMRSLVAVMPTQEEANARASKGATTDLPDPYPNGPRDVLKDINAGHIWYFPTDQGFGSSEFDPTGNPLLEATDEVSDNGQPMVVNDLFRVVHDFFGHGLEGTGFGARGEENAWQSHMRLFTASAVPAMTSETRGQNSWVNFGPHGEWNQKNRRETIYADQKTGLMPSWTWTEGVVDSTAEDVDAPVVAEAAAFETAFLAAKNASPFGAAVHAYTSAEYAQMRTFLAPDGLSGFALKGEDIVSVFSHPASGGGRARKIIDVAVANGGRTLDCFDGKLVQIYSALGFREVRRESWNDEYRPDGWKDEWGKPDVVYMEYGQNVERMVAAPLFGGSRLEVEASGNRGQPRVRDVAQALQDRHNLLDGGKLFPEDSEADYERVLQMGLADFAAQVGQPNSGIGWYSTDVAKAVELTARVFPTLATTPAHRDLYLTFAGIFSNGATPEQAWGMAAEAFDMFLAEGAIQSKRGGSKKWGVRDAANVQQIELVRYLAEREGSLEAAMTWFKTQQPRTAINDAMVESGLYKAGRFTTKAEQQGEAFGFLAFGGKLGRYTLGLHGVELEADNTTVDLWYTRTFRRWTGRLFDAPISAEGIAGGVNSEKEREVIFRLTGDIQKQYPQLTAGDVQAVLWFFEKRLYAEHGVRTSEGTNSSGARKLLSSRGVDASEGSAGAREQGGEDVSLGGSEALAEIERMIGTSSTRQPYALEPTRPTKGVAARPDEAPNDVTLSRIASNLTKTLNLTVRHGRLMSKGSAVMGEFNRRTGVVRLRTWTDLSTLAHEAGHAINDMMAAPLDAFVQGHLADFNAIARKLYGGDLSQATGDTIRREGFAEFFRVYTMTPDFARNRWSQLTADFEALLEREDPKIKAGLNAVAAQVRAWQQMPSGRLIENGVIDGRREQGLAPAMKELRDLGFKSWMQELVRRNVQWSTNRYAAVNRLVSDLLNEGEQKRGAPIDLARGDDPRALIRLARNSGSRAMVQVVDGVIGYRGVQSMSKGLREAIMVSQGVNPDSTPASLDEERLHTFSAYLVARRALEEFRRFEAGELDRAPVSFSKGDAVRAVREWEKEFPDFVKAAQIVHEYGMALWQKSYDAGLISKETYEENLTRQFYVPLQRDLSDKRAAFGDSALTSQGSGPLRSIVRRFRGSDRDIIDPLAVLMQKTFALDQLIAENDAKKALAVLSDRVGQAGALVERIPAHQLIGQQYGVGEIARKLTDLDDISDTDAADLMTLLGASIKDGDTISLFRSQQAAAKGEPVLFFWENGKVAAIQVKDGDIGADVVNTMNAIGRENMDKWLEGVAATSTVFRTAITSWPDFLMVNFVRDQLSAWILTDVGFTPFVSGVRGVIDEVRQKGWAKLYNASQGTMGGMNVAALHTARVDRDIRSLRAKGYIANVFGEVRSGWDFPSMAKGLARVSALTETGTRLGLFKGAFDRAKREGLDDYQASVEAAYTATDYIDFGLNGSKMLTTRRLIPFLNAQIQGFYKMVRTLGGDEVAQRKGLMFALTAYFRNINNLPLSRTEKQALRTGRAAWLKMMSLGLISAALHYLFKDDEDYQEAGEYLRTTGWVIPMGNGNVAYIPKPFELAMFANAAERGLEAASGDGEAVNRFLRGVAFNLTPPTTPPAFQLAFELPNNIDTFTGREIVPTYMRALAPELQFDHTTSSLAKQLGETFRWSPMVVDHVLGAFGASAYRDIATMLNAADPTRPTMATTDVPLLRRFVRDVRRGSVSAQDFWAQASSTNGKLMTAAASYKREVDIGNEPAANKRLASMTADQRGFAVLMTHFKAEEKRLSPFYRATQVTTLISGMRRETSSALSLADTTLKDSGETIPLTAAKKREVDTLLSEIARREVRNTLIATGQPGWKGKEVLPVEPTMDMLLRVSPEVYDELQRRWKKRKIYDAETVYEYWPDVRDRLVQDGEFAVLTDAVAVASAGL